MSKSDRAAKKRADRAAKRPMNTSDASNPNSTSGMSNINKPLTSPAGKAYAN